ncbi:MAG: membrane dipeptidase [Cyanobacteria bacterium P01_A01_bin.37]
MPGAGGVIGIGFWGTAVCGDGAGAIARSIRYTADLIGVDYVALGSDFDGAVHMPFDVSHLDQVTNALMEEGCSDEEISKIMGLNVVQLLQQVLSV